MHSYHIILLQSIYRQTTTSTLSRYLVLQDLLCYGQGRTRWSYTRQAPDYIRSSLRVESINQESAAKAREEDNNHVRLTLATSELVQG